MRVAVITDVHANLLALDAVLAEIDSLGVDATCCGGALVGYGSRPNEVCARIQRLGIPTIYGNYDYAIARDLDDCGWPTSLRTTASSAGNRCSGRSSRPTRLEGLHARLAV